MEQKNPTMITLSIVLPLAIFLIAFVWLFPNRTPFVGTEEKLPTRVQEIESRFAEHQPKIVIAGSSIANKAVDEALLEKELGLSKGDVQKLWSGRATIPTIMLMIQQRILAREEKPDLILVFATPAWMLTNKIIDQKEFDLHWTGDLDPVLQENLGLESGLIRDYSKKRMQVQDKTQQIVRYWFGEKPFQLSEEEVNQKFESLFDFENQRKDNVKEQKLIQHNVHETNEEETVDWAMIPEEDQRLVYQLVKQVREQGINIVLVEMPVANSIKELHEIPKEISLEVVQKYSELGAGHLYYFDWEKKGIFSDMHHMNKRGRSLFTEMLATDLQKIKALETDMTVAELPKELIKPKLKWSNKEGLLSNGEQLDIEFSYPWKNLKIEICVSGRRKPQKTMLSIAGTALQTTKNWGTELWCEQAEIAEISKGQSIQLKNEESIELHPHRIRVNDIELLDQPILLPVQADVALLVSGDNPMAPIVEKANPPPWLEKNKEKHPSLAVGEVTKYAELSDGYLIKKQIPWECSPLTAKYQGKSLENTVNLCKNIFNDSKTGDNCFVSQWWLSFHRENIDWSQLQVGLKEHRDCRDPKKKNKPYWWVYPGDSMRWKFGYLKGHYAILRLMGTAMGAGKWRVQVKNEHKIFLDTTIENIDFTKEILMDIPPRMKMNPNVVVEITELEGTNGFLFVRGIELDN